MGKFASVESIKSLYGNLYEKLKDYNRSYGNTFAQIEYKIKGMSNEIEKYEAEAIEYKTYGSEYEDYAIEEFIWNFYTNILILFNLFTIWTISVR